ncbi:hypothetical protein [Nocardiopsis listeri]|uniref:hypothetical protein n=1 Tax=Nocardiopsis listeri TaxID=53440 RepID=UPI0008338958|nr:hypothetical protein [Nocardiopsis listeri]
MDADETQVMTRTAEFTTTQGWETEVRGRVAAAVDRLAGPLAELAERDANDGDTRLLVADFFDVGLNFSKYRDMTTEYRTSGDSIDYAIVLDGALFAPVEVCRIGQELDLRNIQMSRRLAVDKGAEWIYLTNGRVWRVYHMRPTPDGGAPQPVTVVDVDLLDPDAYDRNVDGLFHMTHEAVEHGRLDALRRWHETTEPGPLARTLLSDEVVAAVRARLREEAEHPGHLGEDEEIRRVLTEEVIPRGLIG